MISDPQSPPIVAPTQPTPMSTQAPDAAVGRLNQAMPPWQQRASLPPAGMPPRPMPPQQQVNVPVMPQGGMYGGGFGGGFGGYGGGMGMGGGMPPWMQPPQQWSPPPWAQMMPPWMQNGGYGGSPFNGGAYGYQPPPPPMQNPWQSQWQNPWPQRPQQPTNQAGYQQQQPVNQAGYQAPNGNTGIAGPINNPTPPAPAAQPQPRVQPTYAPVSNTPIIDQSNKYA